MVGDGPYSGITSWRHVRTVSDTRVVRTRVTGSDMTRVQLIIVITLQQITDFASSESKPFRLGAINKFTQINQSVSFKASKTQELQ